MRFLFKRLQECKEQQRKLRDMVFETVFQSNEFAHKMLGTQGTPEYWKERLEFDLERYEIDKLI